MTATYNLKDHELISFHLRLRTSDHILGRDGYIVADKFIIIDTVGNKHLFKEGFASDGGTVPWWLRPMFPSGGKALPAYLIHDQQCDMANKTKSYPIRGSADAGFYHNLRECTYSRWRARLMSQAVLKYGIYLKVSGKLT